MTLRSLLLSLCVRFPSLLQPLCRPKRTVQRLRSQFTEGALSKRLSSTILTVPVGNGLVRQYRLTKDRQNVKYYRCSRCDTLHRKSPSGILARASVRDGVITHHQPQHHPDCHPVRDVTVLAVNIDRNCRMEVRKGHYAPRSVYDAGHQEALHLSAEIGDARSAKSLVATFPAWSSVRHQYGRLQQGKNPPVPNAIDLPPRYHSTLRGVLTGDNERWLLKSDEKHGVFVFAADSDLRLAAECDPLVGDATFKASPKAAYQLYTLHGKYTNSTGAPEWIAVAFALMGSKSEAAHAVVFDAILSKWTELGCQPKFTKFLVDFDPGQLGAVSAAFGAEKLKGCLFHHTQALLRKIKRKGLLCFYNGAFGSKNVIWRWLRLICALPFLPPKLVQVVWDADLRRPPRPPIGWVAPKGFGEWPTAQLQAFSDYVQEFWFDKMPLMWWNHWTTVTDRTSNAAEAFHSVLSKQRTTLAHPSLTKFLPWLQAIHSRLQTRMVQLQAGATPRPKDQRYVRLDERIAKYKTDFRRELLDNPAMDMQMQAAERYLARCAYMMYDVDSAGVSRKAARAVTKKYIRLDAERKLASDLPKRPRPFKARTPSVQPPTQPPPIQPLTQPTERSPLMQLQPMAPSSRSPLRSPPTEQSTELSWATEQSWLEQSPSKELPLSPEESSQPWFATNLIDDDFDSLRGRSWLNDMIIDSYLALIQARSQLVSRQRVYAFMTHFYTMLCSRGYIGVRSWVKIDNIFDQDLLLFPINDRGNHWTLIVVDMRQRRMSYYDSMGNDGSKHLKAIREYLKGYFAEKKPAERFVPFTMVNEKKLPRQHNTWDCGVYLCQYAEHLSRGAPLSFVQADMARFRLQMERELKEGRLLQ
uniref:Ubiquitin-like protease family profile domain-containing protein n=1 Tax=Plectus sambesii TaxID=2011161 RepID=A0A914WLX7_9BILA